MPAFRPIEDCTENILTWSKKHLGCVIMASGLGKRFGGNKLMADFHGKPLICQVLSLTEGLFAHRVVVTRHDEIAHLCQEHHIHVILHKEPYRSDTVRLGLGSLPAELTGCIFFPGDQPLLHFETITALIQAAYVESCEESNINFKGSFHSIYRTIYEDTPGSPILFPKWAFSELMTLPQGKGGGYLTKKYPERVRFVPVRDKKELMDIDTPEDLFHLI